MKALLAVRRKVQNCLVVLVDELDKRRAYPRGKLKTVFVIEFYQSCRSRVC